jgi:pyruvate dehydrogenase E2 component (dihydrolipoamide acetyltransferase)
MAMVVNMPKLGFDMAEGTLIRWVANEGDAIEQGQVLAEIETDKATVEVEASASGVVLKHAVEAGTSVPVGMPIAVIGAAGEEFDLQSLVGPSEATSGSAVDTPGAEPQPAPSEKRVVVSTDE